MAQDGNRINTDIGCDHRHNNATTYNFLVTNLCPGLIKSGWARADPCPMTPAPMTMQCNQLKSRLP